MRCSVSVWGAVGAQADQDFDVLVGDPEGVQPLDQDRQIVLAAGVAGDVRGDDDDLLPRTDDLLQRRPPMPMGLAPGLRFVGATASTGFGRPEAGYFDAVRTFPRTGRSQENGAVPYFSSSDSQGKPRPVVKRYVDANLTALAAQSRHSRFRSADQGEGNGGRSRRGAVDTSPPTA